MKHVWVSLDYFWDIWGAGALSLCFAGVALVMGAAGGWVVAAVAQLIFDLTNERTHDLFLVLGVLWLPFAAGYFAPSLRIPRHPTYRQRLAEIDSEAAARNEAA